VTAFSKTPLLDTIRTPDDLRRHYLDSALVEPDEPALRDVQRAGMQPRMRMANPLKIDYLQ